ncbi:ABC transporter permease [Polymorphum gilvum]|uniref:Oligopeptide transporter, permease protein n=1 Tax=Polymorphum gilvum (strain LMG 25793 / CGMCC 1.9160 / SL003B-26A1) TaxID=991905 RepID=F2J5U8_POLGS|nr:ABC transporter permease [Polymorphum gilvum]ADZ71202.1 Oligopeptide transporter, permease protein [Polymorphum gilvum SL003B-26A1]
MLHQLGLRLIYACLLILAVSIAGFALLRLMPGDFAEVLLMSQMDGTLPDAETVARFSAENGFDAPLPVQYLDWLWRVAQGDLGTSFVTGDPVLEDVTLRLGKSLTLALLALGTGLVISLPVGALCAFYPGSLLDRTFATLAVVGMSIPNFWYALMLALLFSLTLGWLPSTGHGTWAHAVLPTLVIGTSISGVLARYVRGCLLEELSQPYVRTARSKGLSDRRVLLFHAAPNVFPAVLTLTGLQFARVFDGMIIVETLFAWPGIGRLLVDSLLSRDYPLIQACFLVVAASYVLINLVVDYAITLYDPRVRGVV